MKKILLLALLLPNLVVSMFAQSVSVSEAAAFAEGFFQQKSGKKPQSIKQVYAASMRGATPNYYIFEPSEGKGYVLVAANKASEPVLGYSLSGTFPTEQMPAGMRYLLEVYDEQLNYMKTNRVAGTPAIQAKWENRTVSEEKNLFVAPLLSTTWDQGWPYNLECPTNTMGGRAITGCVATAMAQLMNYWNFPTQANPDFNVCHTDSNPFDAASDVMGSWCRPIGGGYNWSLMRDNYDAGSNEAQQTEVAKLMADCGVAAKMDYGTRVSNATADDAASAMDNWFGYSSCPIYIKSEYSDYDWISIMKTNLNSGRPMYYGGDNRTDVESEDDAGHAWVVDGFEGNHFHMNWGWNGDENGSFLLSLLNPEIGGDEITLTNNQHMFVPIPEGLCTLQETLTGNQSNVYVDVAHRIIANATVYPWTSTAFNAGEEIVLTDGFTAYAGSDFHAYLLGCDGYFNDTENQTQLQVREIEQEVFVATASELKVAPNPFSGSTTVTYSLQDEQQVAMQLMDATGKLVATPMRPQSQSEGAYEFSLDGSNLPAGMYFLVTQIGKTRETKRLVVTK